MKCYNCGKVGHKKTECPEKNKSNNDTKCYNCGKEGHKMTECPEKNKSNNDTKCYNCGKVGHKKTECPEKNKSNNDNKCYNCGKVGHKKTECPEKNKNNNNTKCYNCGKIGHKKTECPEKDKKNKKDENKLKENEDTINDEENNLINCPICLYNSKDDKKFKVSKCGHIICKDCCDSLFKNSNTSHCPLCKKSVNKTDFMDIFI